ncbi:MAG: hypothetical protein B6D44_11670 [Ignavibacteriales bacterium UTCHB2]|jgi:hypothetical protein|nr:MAG: hypothetical protein B6D44_11670 [Ignavibacteriales bacterium UTCHB2]
MFDVNFHGNHFLTSSIKNISFKKVIVGVNNNKTKLAEKVGACLRVNYKNDKTKEGLNRISINLKQPD